MDHCMRLKYSGQPLSDDQAIQKLFVITQVCLVRCVKTNSGYKVFLANSQDMTPFLTTAGQKKLSEEGFNTITSPETKAKCTVVARKLDRTVLAKTVEAIIQEVATVNAVTVLDVYKPPNSRVAKIRCSAPEEAQKLLKGFRLFSTSVPSYNVEPEDYIHIQQCYKCYQYNHYTKECTNKQICSRCGDEGHFFTGCQKPVKCHNCGGDHTAVSGSCPLKKEQVKQTKQAHKTITTTIATATNQPPAHKTYATTTATNQPTRNTQPPAPLNIQQPTQQTQQVQQVNNIHPQVSTEDKTNTITSCIKIAREYSNNNRKTFAKLINEIFLANKLNTVTIPESWLTDEPLTQPQ
ncbi:MAG: hypothetical protein AAGJ80_14635, partial [Cyanobacteria bacterium J06553_1]